MPGWRARLTMDSPSPRKELDGEEEEEEEQPPSACLPAEVSMCATDIRRYQTDPCMSNVLAN